jgi:hypothetical protein
VWHGPWLQGAPVASDKWLPCREDDVDKRSIYSSKQSPLRNRTVDLLLTIDKDQVRELRLRRSRKAMIWRYVPVRARVCLPKLG